MIQKPNHRDNQMSFSRSHRAMAGPRGPAISIFSKLLVIGICFGATSATPARSAETDDIPSAVTSILDDQTVVSSELIPSGLISMPP
jgi:hypothetical protein